MYLEHFGLSEPPFRITPHTDFFFDGADRGATLEALIYAILNDEGIVKVSGEVGSGKTMLCRVLMERLPAQVETIYLTTPSLGRDEILYAIADELQLEFSQGRMSVALRELQEHLIRLYAEGRRVVVLIDEAHAMPEETLEQVRLLSNLETSRHKLLQIVLFGQPELDQALARPTLRQLKDRITHSFRMRPLSEAEVARYLSFRMRAAGYRGPDVFTPKAVALIARASDGLTRRINILADKSLLSAFSADTHAITARHARAAIADSEFSPLRRAKRPALYLGAALVAGIVIGLALHWAPSAPPAAPPATAAAKPAAAPAPPPPAAPAAAAAPTPPPKPAPVEAAKAAPVAAEAPAPAALLSPEQLRRIERYDSRGQPLLGERIAAARALLEREPDARYSVELFITDNTDPARMERFLSRARDLALLREVYVIPLASGRSYRLRVVYGDFPDRAAALDAERNLPPKYQKEFRSTPRSFADLRRPM
ncbi:MAG TPA: AAA family ATPase [Burkholderiales bacterium]|nr:AAA family ATPase [Burkholderiales bacterium]